MAGAGAGLPRRTRGVCPGPLPTMRPAPGARFENYRPGLRGRHPALRWGPGAGGWRPLGTGCTSSLPPRRWLAVMCGIVSPMCVCWSPDPEHRST